MLDSVMSFLRVINVRNTCKCLRYSQTFGRVVVWLVKYNVYRYIGCIMDQSNWSGPFSLVVMTPD